jgi:lipoprotein NlpD
MSFFVSVFTKILTIIVVMNLIGCQSSQMAPVEELHPQYAMSHQEHSYVVRPGDTLYAIAFLYDQNVKRLAEFNHMAYPYSVHVGQTIKLAPFESPRQFKNTYLRFKPTHPIYTSWKSNWQWPTMGKVAPKNLNNPIEAKGITIIGRPNQNVVAAAKGVVAYAGNGLPGYGNLILIKHPNDYLSAYAFNSNLQVREGQLVQQGQKIANMGMVDSSHWGLHFEIRYHGQTLNPLKYLPRR